MKPCRTCLLTAVGALTLWVGYRAYRAHENLVTLDVRNMDVRRVVSKLQWQTWERILVNKNVNGSVTLNVKSVPLDEVLNVIALQTDSRWSRLYPLYTSKKSFTAFNQVLQGTAPADNTGWTGLQQLAMWQQAGLGGFANRLRAENKLVSAQIADKDPVFTALALSRFSKAQVVPEDGTMGTVNLTLQQVPFDKAVAKVARQLHRKWQRVYTLQPLNSPTVVRKAPAEPTDNQTAFVDDTNQVATAPMKPLIAPDKALEALTATMTPEERQQLIDQVAGGGQPGGGAQYAGGGGTALQPGAAGAAAGPGGTGAQPQPPAEDIETKIDNRLKNGTIEQRLSHDRRVLTSKQTGGK